jgi:predicted transcriptional regulator
MKPRREHPAKTALRRLFLNGESVYHLDIAETYGIRTQTAMDYCKQLSYEGVCKRGALYYRYNGKGYPLAYRVWVSRVPAVEVHPNVLFINAIQ